MSQPVGPLPDIPDINETPPRLSLAGPTLPERELPARGEPRPAGKITEAAELAGEKVGEVVGFAKHEARELPQRLEGMKQRFKLIQGRAAANARAAASEMRQTAGFRIRQARDRFNYLARECPLETVLAIGGTAFVLGFALRVWRSNRD